jgi:hypothetical protein
VPALEIQDGKNIASVLPVIAEIRTVGGFGGAPLAGLGHDSPTTVPVLMVPDVICGAGFRVREGPIGFHDKAKSVGVACILIVGMELLGKVVEETLNRLAVGTRAYLE